MTSVDFMKMNKDKDATAAANDDNDNESTQNTSFHMPVDYNCSVCDRLCCMLFRMTVVNQVVLTVMNIFDLSLASAFLSYRCARILLLEQAFSHLLI